MAKKLKTMKEIRAWAAKKGYEIDVWNSWYEIIIIIGSDRLNSRKLTSHRFKILCTALIEKGF